MALPRPRPPHGPPPLQPDLAPPRSRWVAGSGMVMKTLVFLCISEGFHEFQ